MIFLISFHGCERLAGKAQRIPLLPELCTMLRKMPSVVKEGENPRSSETSQVWAQSGQARGAGRLAQLPWSHRNYPELGQDQGTPNKTRFAESLPQLNIQSEQKKPFSAASG